MTKIYLFCAFALLGLGGWAYHQRTATGRDLRNAMGHDSPQPDRATRNSPPRLDGAEVASAMPVTTKPPAAPNAMVEPPRHVAPAGTLTKEQLISAINKDAKESSLEAILGAPNSTKSMGWDSRYYWAGKLDTGGDSPETFAAEVAQYNGIPLVVGVYDTVSGFSTFLPWHDKVVQAYNDALNQRAAPAAKHADNDLPTYTEAQLQATLGSQLDRQGGQGHGAQKGYGTSLVEARRNAIREITLGEHGDKWWITSESSKIVSTNRNGTIDYVYQINFDSEWKTR